jgi:hypothetical protein
MRVTDVLNCKVSFDECTSIVLDMFIPIQVIIAWETRVSGGTKTHKDTDNFLYTGRHP